MDVLSASGFAPTDSFFSTMQQRNQAGGGSISQQVLTTGLSKYTKGNYEGAVRDFRTSIGFAPGSASSAKATPYLAGAYLKLGRTDDAVRAYKSAASLHQYNDELHTQLGNLYYSLERFDEAEDEYRDAVRIYRSGANLYSLGQATLKNKKYGEAEDLFKEVSGMQPKSGDPDFALGQVYRAQGRHDDAIEMFESAISKKENFADAHYELGLSLIDKGETEKAEDVIASLFKMDVDMAETLAAYLYKNEDPKFSRIGAQGTFPRALEAGEDVSWLDESLQKANASKEFTMVFFFSKQMDASSVLNTYNWNIKRSDKTGPGEAYNFGIKLPDTEANIPLYPDSVTYDPKEQKATVTFTLSQNSTGDATIDPRHILFSFSGEDTFGNDMHEDYDEYMRATGVV